MVLWIESPGSIRLVVVLVQLGDHGVKVMEKTFYCICKPY